MALWCLIEHITFGRSETWKLQNSFLVTPRSSCRAGPEVTFLQHLHGFDWDIVVVVRQACVGSHTPLGVCGPHSTRPMGGDIQILNLDASPGAQPVCFCRAFRLRPKPWKS